jgi:hypothetical protein
MLCNIAPHADFHELKLSQSATENTSQYWEEGGPDRKGGFEREADVVK